MKINTYYIENIQKEVILMASASKNESLKNELEQVKTELASTLLTIKEEEPWYTRRFQNAVVEGLKCMSNPKNLEEELIITKKKLELVKDILEKVKRYTDDEEICISGEEWKSVTDSKCVNERINQDIQRIVGQSNPARGFSHTFPTYTTDNYDKSNITLFCRNVPIKTCTIKESDSDELIKSAKVFCQVEGNQ